jgi:uncharacterized membrane protein
MYTEVRALTEQKKSKYIKYTHDQLAAVPTPSQRDHGDGASSVITSTGIGAGLGAVAGKLLGMDPVIGAVIGGSAGLVKGAKDQK